MDFGQSKFSGKTPNYRFIAAPGNLKSPMKAPLHACFAQSDTPKNAGFFVAELYIQVIDLYRYFRFSTKH